MFLTSRPQAGSCRDPHFGIQHRTVCLGRGEAVERTFPQARIGSVHVAGGRSPVSSAEAVGLPGGSGVLRCSRAGRRAVVRFQSHGHRPPTTPGQSSAANRVWQPGQDNGEGAPVADMLDPPTKRAALAHGPPEATFCHIENKSQIVCLNQFARLQITPHANSKPIRYASARVCKLVCGFDPTLCVYDRARGQTNFEKPMSHACHALCDLVVPRCSKLFKCP